MDNQHRNRQRETSVPSISVIDARDTSDAPTCGLCGHVHLTRATVINGIKSERHEITGVETHRRITMCHVGGCAAETASSGGCESGVNMIPPHWHDRPHVLGAFMAIMDIVASKKMPLEPIDVLDLFATVIVNLSISVPNESVANAMDGMREVVVGKHKQINEINEMRRKSAANDDCVGTC